MSAAPQAVSITLGQTTFEVSALPLGQIKRLLAAISRASLALHIGRFDESLIDDLLTVISATVGKPVSELEQISGNLAQLDDAFVKCVQVSGLQALLDRAKDERSGERVPGASPASTPSMQSTPSSAPTSDGPGSTSTNA